MEWWWWFFIVLPIAEVVKHKKVSGGSIIAGIIIIQIFAGLVHLNSFLAVFLGGLVAGIINKQGQEIMDGVNAGTCAVALNYGINLLLLQYLINSYYGNWYYSDLFNKITSSEIFVFTVLISLTLGAVGGAVGHVIKERNMYNYNI